MQLTSPFLFTYLPISLLGIVFLSISLMLLFLLENRYGNNH